MTLRTISPSLVLLFALLQTVRPELPHSPADEQYRRWVSAGRRSLPVPVAPNGIAFPSGYKNWQVISSTDRTDTDTLKMILGNDVAIQAVADHKTNPWPNGTAFAKVSWAQQPDGNGLVRTGKFEQVAFMFKDSQKYASTAGWGWAQWMGVELKPFGKDANFATECVACHQPLQKNDYVFTAPVAEAGSATALAGKVPFDPLKWRIITSGVDRRNSTMFTVFGNDAAVEYSRINTAQKYPAGSVIALATWHQQEDSRWSGAKIAARVMSVEFVDVRSALDSQPSHLYRAYEGSPLKEITTSKSQSDQRAAYLLSLRAAVMP